MRQNRALLCLLIHSDKIDVLARRRPLLEIGTSAGIRDARSFSNSNAVESASGLRGNDELAEGAEYLCSPGVPAEHFPRAHFAKTWHRSLTPTVGYMLPTVSEGYNVVGYGYTYP